MTQNHIVKIDDEASDYLVQIIEMNAYDPKRVNLANSGRGRTGALKAIGQLFYDYLVEEDTPWFADNFRTELDRVRRALPASVKDDERSRLNFRLAELNLEDATRAMDRFNFFDEAVKFGTDDLRDEKSDNPAVADLFIQNPGWTVLEAFQDYIQELLRKDNRELVLSVVKLQHFEK